MENIFEPLNIISKNALLEFFRYHAKVKTPAPYTRGMPFLTWDNKHCGNGLTIHDDEFTVSNKNSGHQTVRTKEIICGKGIYEWDIIIEECCVSTWVGVCTESGLDYNDFAGYQPHGWAFGSCGSVYNNNKESGYASSFGKGDRISVHLNMNEKTCAFSINGTKYGNVAAWTNLSDRLYPVVSITTPGRSRIQLYKKFNR
ncbi:16482_t:CDS:1 [Funneliformis geosporum]|nr:16482_t:CDS:1 [Funneliformis geosporum]